MVEKCTSLRPATVRVVVDFQAAPVTRALAGPASGHSDTKTASGSKASVEHINATELEINID